MSGSPLHDRIFVRELTFEAIIGVLPHERHTPQPLQVDIELETQCIPLAAASDALEDTLDYAAIANEVTDLCQQAQAQLVETLAERIAQHLLLRSRITGVALRVSKPAALDAAAAVGVSIYRTR